MLRAGLTGVNIERFRFETAADISSRSAGVRNEQRVGRERRRHAPGRDGPRKRRPIQLRRCARRPRDIPMASFVTHESSGANGVRHSAPDGASPATDSRQMPAQDHSDKKAGASGNMRQPGARRERREPEENEGADLRTGRVRHAAPARIRRTATPSFNATVMNGRHMCRRSSRIVVPIARSGCPRSPSPWPLPWCGESGGRTAPRPSRRSPCGAL
jgi:hypothetical protein